MWRRSVVSRISSRISVSSSLPTNPRLIPWSRELCVVNSFTEPPLPSESTAKLGITGVRSDANRVFASGTVAAAATTGEISSRVAAVAGLGHHYARCYWDLSKARLSVVNPPELLIIGCGRDIHPVTPEVRQFVKSIGMKLETVDSRNAASTYNILNEEGRVVAAALLPYGVTS
ncbi:PREDICTED: protoheme IX farnesyltransferase, mitochondrial-like [Camelina sativa]|uniref:Protoheme IX farnesyltransferase, mitochondrial-like n=1 Tax=Camelina sativa TaxID=90675 RepID=A0ABM0YV03_CAMSA|nr:PREDICTED: protoheme IX farnesyltransferase, mitochondrial-like [Camelina sativa]